MVVPVEAEKEVIITEVADEIPPDRGLEVQVPVEVESGGTEVARVADKGKK